MKQQMYIAKFKFNNIDREKEQRFIGVDEKEVLEVIDTYCKDESMTRISDIKLVDDNFDFNPVAIDMDMTLLSGDFK